MRYSIWHKTTYIYQDIVSKCYNVGWLVPRNLKEVQIFDFQVRITPSPRQLYVDKDFFENKLLRFDIQEPHEKLEIFTSFTAEIEYTEPQNILLFQRGASCQRAWDTWKSIKQEIIYAKQFLYESPYIRFFSEAKSYGLESIQGNRSIFESVMELMQRIYSDFEFKSGYTTVSTPVEVVYRERKGVCQDFAHVMITCLRMCGIAARYVSGYIETTPPKGKEKLVGADASHAWVSVFFPEYGWLEFDPTNNCLPTHQHIPVAYGRDYSDVPPLKGVVYGSGKQELKVAVDVHRI